MAVFHDRKSGSFTVHRNPDVTHVALWSDANSGSTYEWPHVATKQKRTVKNRVARLSANAGIVPENVRVLTKAAPDQQSREIEIAQEQANETNRGRKANGR